MTVAIDSRRKREDMWAVGKTDSVWRDAETVLLGQRSPQINTVGQSGHFALLAFVHHTQSLRFSKAASVIQCYPVYHES